MAAQSPFKNAILARLPEPERELIEPHLEPVDLPRYYVLAFPGGLIDYVHFLERGLGSVTCTATDGKTLQIAMFGAEGFAPTPPAARFNRSLHGVVMQTDGQGYRIRVPDLWDVMTSSPVLTELLTKAMLNMASQASFEALSLAASSVELRLAKWLLMAHDRVAGDEVFLTHDTLAELLGVRRPSVTTSLHALEGKGFIKSTRGRVILKNRSAMERYARDVYGWPERELKAMLGV